MIHSVHLKRLKMKLADWQISDFHNLRHGHGHGKDIN